MSVVLILAAMFIIFRNYFLMMIPFVTILVSVLWTMGLLAATVGEIAWELKIIAEYSSAIAEIAIDNVLLDENIICKVIEPSTST